VPTIAEFSKAKSKLVGTLALCPPYGCLFVVENLCNICVSGYIGLRLDDRELALIIQLHLTVAPKAKIAETLNAARFRQLLDSRAEYLVVDGQVVFATVRHGFPDHHRGFLLSRCQHGKDDRIEISLGYGFWKRHVFPPQVTVYSGARGGWSQFWMLSVDQLQHLNMQTGSQFPEGMDEWPPIFLVEFTDSCESLVDGVVDCEQVPSNPFRLHLVHGLYPCGSNVEMDWNKLRTL
jgi:hypothetical protein